MPASRTRGQAYGGITLLSDADQRHGSPGHRMVGNHHRPFIQHEFGLHAPLRKHSRGRSGTFTACLLVMSEDEVHRAQRLPARRGHCFGRLQHRHQRALVVEGAAAVDRNISHLAGKGRKHPSIFCFRRHDVLVRHQDDGGEPGIATRPLIQQSAGAHDLSPGPRMEGRIGARQPVVELGPFIRAGLWILMRADGPDADGLPQMKGRALQIEVRRGHCCRHRGRRTPGAGGPPSDHRDEGNEQQCKRSQPDPPGFPRMPLRPALHSCFRPVPDQRPRPGAGLS